MEVLNKLLLPCGIKVFSTGAGELGQYVDLLTKKDPHWLEKNIAALPRARAILLGVPCDNGAGFRRGSKFGPMSLRTAMIKSGLYQKLCEKGLVDIGDIRDQPLLSHDSYLNKETIERIQRARWGEEGVKSDLSVSPHSILEKVFDVVAKANPTAPIFMIGGDHSHSRPPVEHFAKRFEDIGVLQFDAHTDLLHERDGLDISYACWSYYAAKALKGKEKLLQLGVRVSGKTAEQWLEQTGVRQIWAKDCKNFTPQMVVDHFRKLAVKRLYISCDVDSLDPSFVDATGTIEKNGLTPEYEKDVIHACREAFEIVGTDVMEFAPLYGDIEKSLQSAMSLVEVLCTIPE